MRKSEEVKLTKRCYDIYRGYLKETHRHRPEYEKLSEEEAHAWRKAVVQAFNEGVSYAANV